MVWEKFLAAPLNPALVSFPRTGSHWLRMLLELTIGIPSLKRQFFYFHPTRYSFWHTHDDDLKFQRERVVYLHRDPVDTVFSQLQYHRISLADSAAVMRCGAQYLSHLEKWLGFDHGAGERLVISYESLASEPAKTVAQIVRFLEESWSSQRFDSAYSQVTKEVVRRKTERADDRVISINRDYATARREFRERYTGMIRQQFEGASQNMEGVFA